MECSAFQDMPNLSALCNNGITNLKNETLIHMVNFSTTFCCTGYTTCSSNIEHTTDDKRFDGNTFFKTLPKNIQHENYCITCTTNMVEAKYYYMIHLQLKRPFYEH
jgi:hypothetical protein